MRTLQILAFTVFAFVTNGWVCAEGQEPGEAPAFVEVPADASPAELHAAEELARHVKLMTDRTLALIKEGESRPQGRAFIVGHTRSNIEQLDPDEWPRDTIYIGYSPDSQPQQDIRVVGQGPQGTLFAVYEFLRDQGCRWYMPDDHWPMKSSSPSFIR